MVLQENRNTKTNPYQSQNKKPRKTSHIGISVPLFVVFIVFVVVIGLIVFSELVYTPTSALQYIVDSNSKEKVWPLHTVVLDPTKDTGRKVEEPPREAVLLMHGVLGSSAVWQHSLEIAWPTEERDRYQMIIPDLLGHGRSPSPQNISYTVKQHVDSIIDVLVKSVPAGRPLHIVGTSLSGPLAVAVASRLVRCGHKKQWPLLSVTLVVPAYFPGADRDRIVGLLKSQKPYLRLENTFYLFSRYLAFPLRFLLFPLARKFCTDKWPQSAYRDTVALHGVSTDAYAVRSSVESLVVRYDIDNGLDTLCKENVPVLFIDASDDWIKRHDPERNIVKNKTYSCVEHRVVEGTHKVFAQQPEKIVLLLREFINQRSVSPTLASAITGVTEKRCGDEGK